MKQFRRCGDGYEYVAWGLSKYHDQVVVGTVCLPMMKKSVAHQSRTDEVVRSGAFGWSHGLDGSWCCS